MFEYWFMFPISICVATLAMISGIGGGIIFMPIMTLFLGVSPHAAVGTAILTELFGMGSGTVNYVRRGMIEKRVALLLVSATVPGMIVGFFLALSLQANLLKFLFGIFCLFMGTLMLVSIFTQTHGRRTRVRPREIQRALWVPFFAGISEGMFSVGSSEINTFYLERKLKLKMHYAVATGIAVLPLAAIVASIFYAKVGMILLEIAMFTIPGVLIGGQIGPHIASKVNENVLKFVYIVLISIFGIGMCLSLLA